MKLNFPPLCLSCPQWWSGPLVRPLPSGYGISELGGGAHYRRYKEKILHQRLQVAGADGRSVCMLVFVTNSSRIFFYKFNFARNLHPWKWIQADHVTGSWKCPSSAASCLKVGDEYVSLGQLESGPTWDMSVLKLQYTSGQACPDGRRNRSSIIRFKCDKDKVVRVHRTNDWQYKYIWFLHIHTVWRDPPLLDSFRDASLCLQPAK